ncbi:MAG: glycine-rich protein, partial [Patescibacteria group bacterium]
MKKLLPIFIALILPSIAFAGTRTFNHTGGDQTFIVPAGVTSINVALWGANGGSRIGAGSGLESSDGGIGGYTTGALSVTPGQVLGIVVGGSGTGSAINIYTLGVKPGGYGGGGNGFGGAGGGGRSAVRISNEDIMTAGGGGGADADWWTLTRTHGGNGGGLIGANGVARPAWGPSSGLGGTQNEGGLIGGTKYRGGSCNASVGQGGGGGGWYGGGCLITGGGGSGHCGGPGVSGCTTTFSAGSPAGVNGRVVITWTNPICPIHSHGTHPSCVCDTGYTSN